MNTYAAYNSVGEWIGNVKAADEAEALDQAKRMYPGSGIISVKLTHGMR